MIAIAAEMLSLTIYVFITKKEIAYVHGLIFITLISIIPMSLTSNYYYMLSNDTWAFLIFLILYSGIFIIFDTK
jgi:hypothetical protein